MELLLERGASVNMPVELYGSALQASLCGRWPWDFQVSELEPYEILLNHGTDANQQGGTYGNPLQAACFFQDEKVVNMLLNKGANINTQGGGYGSALLAAKARGYSLTSSALVNLLLSKGAEDQALESNDTLTGSTRR
jgi:ankyrin repeat protein